MASYALHAGTRIVQVFDPSVTPVVRLRRVDAGANAFEGKYLTFDASGNADFVAAPSATIGDGTVTNAKLANVATSTIKGRATSGTGAPEDLTADQVSTILDSAADPFVRTSAAGSGITELTGDVTAGPGSGSQAATVANAAITNAKLANMAQDTIKGRVSGSGTGAPVDLTATQARAILNVADGANAYVHPNHSGDVTSSGDGATTIANSAVTYAKIQNVSATDKLLGRSTSGAGVVEEIACTAAGRNLLDDADAAAQRTTLGLGSMATQAASAVAITGGTIATLTSLGVSGAATIGTTLGVTGATTLSSSLSVTGETLLAAGFRNVEAAVTISAGAISTTACSLGLDTEGGAASDDLDTVAVTGATNGSWLFLRTISSARDVVVKHNTGVTNGFRLVGSADFTLTTSNSVLVCRRNTGIWCEQYRATLS